MFGKAAEFSESTGLLKMIPGHYRGRIKPETQLALHQVGLASLQYGEGRPPGPENTAEEARTPMLKPTMGRGEGALHAGPKRAGATDLGERQGLPETPQLCCRCLASTPLHACLCPPTSDAYGSAGRQPDCFSFCIHARHWHL